MMSLIASLVLAAVLPTDFLDSVGVAAYWYRKDARGKGDPISEEAKPKRFPAFAVSADTFILADPGVRSKHLDKVEFWYGGKRYPAKEIARGENPDTVMIRTEKPIDGMRPLQFVKGEPAQKLTWAWRGDALNVESGSAGTNADVRISAVTRRAFHQGKKDTLLLDKERRPVALDFGNLSPVQGERFAYPDAVALCKEPVDSLDKAAGTIEGICARAVLPIVIRLEQQEKTTRRRYSWEDDVSSKTEFDALGVVIDGRILVPSGMDGEMIARFKSAEATFADGSRTNLVFAGALAEWNAVVFSLPEGCASKVGSLSVCAADPHAMLGDRGWLVSVENEGGRPVADVIRARFTGVSFIRGAKFTVAVGDYQGAEYARHWIRFGSEDKSGIGLVVDAAGAVATMSFKRRYGGRYENPENIAPGDLADVMAGRAFNPEFRPRAEEDRNRAVWLGVESVELTEALAREKKLQSFIQRYSRPLFVTEVYPGSPCAKAGVRIGDVLLAYRRGNEEEKELRAGYDYSGRDWSAYFESDGYSYYGVTATPWSDVENEQNRELSKYGVGAKVTLISVRDGKRCETELALDAAPPHYKNAPKSRNRALGTLVKDMTFEVRRYFKFDDQAPGVVIAKIKPGSPAAVAGLKVYELITEVNGEKVTGAKDFAAKIKDKKDLVFAVRRLSQTRMVKIHVQ